MSRNALFDVMVVLQNTALNNKNKQQHSGALKVSEYEGGKRLSSKFDLLFNFVEIGEEIQANIEFDSDIYNKSTIERLGDHLEQLLVVIIEQPSTPIQDLDYLSVKEKNQLLMASSAAAAQYPRDKTIVDLFEDQVAKTPDNIALVYEKTMLTYKELNEQSNQLAHYLRKNYGIRADDLVGILQERSEKIIVTILGILKSGAAYVPIDPEYPQERINYMIEDSKCKVVIDKEEWQRFKEEEKTYGRNNPKSVNRPSDLAYVIYTSGTTGKPKGALIEHKNVVRLFKTDKPMFDFNSTDIWTMFHSYCFDFSVWEMYGALLYGGRLIMFPSIIAMDPDACLDLIIKEGVTVLNQTPSSFYNLIKKEMERKATNLQLRYVIFGGEALSPVKLSDWRERYPGVKLINMYGITETTVHVTYKEITKEDIEKNSSNIGKPIPTLSCYILDKIRNQVPVGVVGELYVGGDGVARGYLNKEELTSQRFLTSPFRDGERLYRSGDMVKRLESGELEYLGRVDDQVKIRGYRIELPEIERALQRHLDISSAIVLATTNNEEEKELVAYVVSGKSLNTSDLRSFLSASLPFYMLPNYYVQLDQLPLTANGKVDKKALPQPKEMGMDAGGEYMAPESEMEKEFVLVWQEILSKDKIGVRDNFFELGGDSIKVLRMVALLRKKLNLNIPIADIYKNSTIEGILTHLAQNVSTINEANRRSKEKESIVRDEIGGLRERILSSRHILNKENIEDIYPMSDIEKGMVFEASLNADLGVYHDQTVHQRCFIEFDIERFRRAMELLVEKHPILRTSFHVSDYETEVQIVHKRIDISIRYEDLSGLPGKRQEIAVQEYMKRERKKPFNVSKAPLWRMRAFNSGGDRILFVSQCHHAIIDGWSEALFMTELNNLYLKLGEDPLYKPEALKSSYKDFIIQHEIDKRDDQINEFWLNELFDYSRLDIFAEDEELRTYSYSVDADTAGKLKKTAVDLNTTLKVLSLSAYLYMLKMLSADAEILTGLVTNNRPNCEDSDKVLGCFLNTIPLKITMEENETCSEFVAKIHNKLIELKSVEGLGLNNIAQIHKKGPVFANPFFDTLFNYVDFHAYESISDDDKSRKEEQKTPVINVNGYVRTNTHFDFSIDATRGGYRMNIQLGKQLKSGFSPQRIGELYLDILAAMVNYPARVIHVPDRLSAEEKHRVLFEFNDTKVPYPRNRTVAELFEEQAAKTPDKIALVFGKTALSYGQLNERSNQLANYLRSHYKIAANDLIGVKLARNEWMIIAIMGVLKSGGVYLPIDPEYPPDRIDYMITDSKCKLVIDEGELAKFRKEQGKFTKENLNAVNGPDDLVYVIYTSGSTGRPKGAKVKQHSFVNLILWYNKLLELQQEDCVFLMAPISFDLAQKNIFTPLISGARLCLPGELYADYQALANAIVEQGVTVLNSAPSAFYPLLNVAINDNYEKLSSLRKIVLGGEPIMINEVRDWVKSGMYNGTIINSYGPTECTDVVAYYIVNNNEWETIKVIPIGTPVDNCKLYILDSDGELTPVGLTGEIFVAGVCVGGGYLYRPELTAEKFRESPFIKGEWMYRTGDLGRRMPDGNIEFVGRKDNQVKIRGYRVEPGEIENALQNHPEIDSAVVVARPAANGEKELIAYIVSRQRLVTTDIRAFLGMTLSDYMIPAYFVQLEKLPINPNGKVDRKNLPAPEGLMMATGVAYVAPRSEMEEKLVSIWQEVLGKEKVGVKDSFFELGGHSLKAMKLQQLLDKKLGIHLKIQDIYNHPTIEEMGFGRHGNSRTIKLNSGHAALKTGFYFIPPVLGSSILFKPIADVLQDTAICYGLEYSGLEKGEPLYGSIEESALDLSAQIIANQTHDEIIILGYSMGAPIAFEIAKILEAKFIPLKLILIDREVSKSSTVPSDKMDREAEWLVKKYQALISDQAFDVKYMHRFLKNNIRILNEYNQNGKIKSKIFAFEASGNKTNTRMDEWNNYTEGGMSHYFVKGGHWDVFADKNLSQIKMLLKYIVSESQIRSLFN